jgi:hypothetical protein
MGTELTQGFSLFCGGFRHVRCNTISETGAGLGLDADWRQSRQYCGKALQTLDYTTLLPPEAVGDVRARKSSGNLLQQ